MQYASTSPANAIVGKRLAHGDVTWCDDPAPPAGLIRIDCERGGLNFNIWIVRQVMLPTIEERHAAAHLVTIYRLTRPPSGRKLVGRFVFIGDAGRANFEAGKAIDRLTDADGLQYDYRVEPIDMQGDEPRHVAALHAVYDARQGVAGRGINGADDLAVLLDAVDSLLALHGEA